MNGYLRSLDTVNFNVDSEENISGALKKKVLDSKGDIILHGLFYDICLSPNQIIDLSPIQKLFSEVDKLSLSPLTIYLDPDCLESGKPFEKQLLKYLRREGDDAFIFSSSRNAKNKSKKWGRELLEAKRKLSDSEILSLARDPDYYEEIVEWVAKLDKDFEFNLMPLRAFNPGYNYESLFSLYWNHFFPNDKNIELSKAISRSHAYQLLESKTFKDEEAKEEFPDLISNVLYTLGTNSRLVLDSKFKAAHEDGSEIINDYATVTIDIDRLNIIIPNIKEKLIEADLNEVFNIRYHYSTELKKAWGAVGLGDLIDAEKKFKNILKGFLVDMKLMPSYYDGFNELRSIFRTVIDKKTGEPSFLNPDRIVDSMAIFWKRLKFGINQFVNVSKTND